jgi:outer membrane immunogenic protein
VGAAYGKIRNTFSTSNTVNTVTLSKTKKNAWGLVWGGGIEQKIGKFSIGTLYTMTTFKNHDHTVRLGPPFVANPANPFIAQNAAGTDFRRSFSKFAFHSIRATVSYRF